MLELPPHIEQVLIERAEQQGISVAQMLAQDYAPKVAENTPQNPMLARAMANNNPSVLGNGLTIQRELRSEWD